MCPRYILLNMPKKQVWCNPYFYRISTWNSETLGGNFLKTGKSIALSTAFTHSLFTENTYWPLLYSKCHGIQLLHSTDKSNQDPVQVSALVRINKLIQVAWLGENSNCWGPLHSPLPVSNLWSQFTWGQVFKRAGTSVGLGGPYGIITSKLSASVQCHGLSKCPRSSCWMINCKAVEGKMLQLETAVGTFLWNTLTCL